jgi:hypothetical protein
MAASIPAVDQRQVEEGRHDVLEFVFEANEKDIPFEVIFDSINLG